MRQFEVKDYRIQITYDGSAPVEGESWDDGILSYVVSIDKGQLVV